MLRIDVEARNIVSTFVLIILESKKQHMCLFSNKKFTLSHMPIECLQILNGPL